MTLNGVIALILRFFTEFDSFTGRLYVTVVEDSPIMSVKYCLPVHVFHFWPKLMHPAAWSLCDSWASCETFWLYQCTCTETAIRLLPELNFTLHLRSLCPILCITRNFGNWTTISGICSQFSAVHAQKRLEFHLRSNF